MATLSYFASVGRTGKQIAAVNSISKTPNERRTRLSSVLTRRPLEVHKKRTASRWNFPVCGEYDHYFSFEESEESTDSPDSEANEEEKRRTVEEFWDLDNKPPKEVAPYEAATSLRDLASEFGLVVDMVAYANHHAFTYVPQWIRDERQERKRLSLLEEQGLLKPDSSYRCQYCGRKCETYLKLKKHFKQLHERERNKRLTHLNYLKGKKRQKFKEKLAEKEDKYQAIASQILVPRKGYGLAPELKRTGVYVRTVEDRPQTADEALMKHMTVYINRDSKR